MNRSVYAPVGTIEELARDWEICDEEAGKFDRVEDKRSSRPDIHAFILLNELVPDEKPIVTAATHDQFYIGVDMDKLVQVINRKHIVELVRCGVRLEPLTESLFMFT